MQASTKSASRTDSALYSEAAHSIIGGAATAGLMQEDAPAAILAAALRFFAEA